ncbi:hypothetical protein C172_05303 [Paenibacillus sp. FSL H8-457]|nr:hypothetical protein C172_05303 [Paenibacillus sp. FSL H8-457]
MRFGLAYKSPLSGHPGYDFFVNQAGQGINDRNLAYSKTLHEFLFRRYTVSNLQDLRRYQVAYILLNPLIQWHSFRRAQLNHHISFNMFNIYVTNGASVLFHTLIMETAAAMDEKIKS